MVVTFENQALEKTVVLSWLSSSCVKGGSSVSPASLPSIFSASCEILVVFPELVGFSGSVVSSSAFVSGSGSAPDGILRVSSTVVIVSNIRPLTTRVFPSTLKFGSVRGEVALNPKPRSD